MRLLRLPACRLPGGGRGGRWAGEALAGREAGGDQVGSDGDAGQHGARRARLCAGFLLERSLRARLGFFFLPSRASGGLVAPCAPQEGEEVEIARARVHLGSPRILPKRSLLPIVVVARSLSPSPLPLLPRPSAHLPPLPSPKTNKTPPFPPSREMKRETHRQTRTTDLGQFRDAHARAREIYKRACRGDVFHPPARPLPRRASLVADKKGQGAAFASADVRAPTPRRRPRPPRTRAAPRF